MNEIAKALLRETQDGVTAGASVQILMNGYPTWLAITELSLQGEHLLRLTLADESGVLIGRDAIIGARFGEIDDSE